MEYRIIRRTEVLFMTGLATSTLYAKMQAGEFPRPVKLGRRAVGWKSNAVELWITQQSEAASPWLPRFLDTTMGRWIGMNFAI